MDQRLEKKQEVFATLFSSVERLLKSPWSLSTNRKNSFKFSCGGNLILSVDFNTMKGIVPFIKEMVDSLTNTGLDFNLSAFVKNVSKIKKKELSNLRNKRREERRNLFITSNKDFLRSLVDLPSKEICENISELSSFDLRTTVTWLTQRVEKSKIKDIEEFVVALKLENSKNDYEEACRRVTSIWKDGSRIEWNTRHRDMHHLHMSRK